MVQIHPSLPFIRTGSSRVLAGGCQAQFAGVHWRSVHPQRWLLAGPEVVAWLRCKQRHVRPIGRRRKAPPPLPRGEPPVTPSVAVQTLRWLESHRRPIGWRQGNVGCGLWRARLPLRPSLQQDGPERVFHTEQRPLQPLLSFLQRHKGALLANDLRVQAASCPASAAHVFRAP